jgi:hypothetical protein
MVRPAAGKRYVKIGASKNRSGAARRVRQTAIPPLRDDAIKPSSDRILMQFYFKTMNGTGIKLDLLSGVRF